MSGYKGDAYTERLAEAAYQRDLAEEGRPAVLLRDTPEDRERLILLLAMVPEPIVMRRGVSTGTSEDGAVWGDPEEFTSVEQRADAIIAALRGEE